MQDKLPALKLPYNEVKYYWATSHYDIDWAGYVKYNGFTWKARTEDETDYETMSDSCPYCSDDWPNLDVRTCHCENYVDVYVYLTPMSLIEIIKMYYDKFKWERLERPYLMWKNRKRLA